MAYTSYSMFRTAAAHHPTCSQHRQAASFPTLDSRPHFGGDFLFWNDIPVVIESGKIEVQRMLAFTPAATRIPVVQPESYTSSAGSENLTPACDKAEVGELLSQRELPGRHCETLLSVLDRHSDILL